MADIPMSISAAASFSAARAAADVKSAVAIKALKMANAQQQSVVGLIEGAVESAEALTQEPRRGERVDVSG